MKVSNYMYAFIVGVGCPTVAIMISIPLFAWVDGVIDIETIYQLIISWAVLVFMFYGLLLHAAWSCNKSKHRRPE